MKCEICGRVVEAGEHGNDGNDGTWYDYDGAYLLVWACGDCHECKAQLLADAALGRMVRGMPGLTRLMRLDRTWVAQQYGRAEHMWSVVHYADTPEAALAALHGPDEQLADLMAQAEKEHEEAADD